MYAKWKLAIFLVVLGLLTMAASRVLGAGGGIEGKVTDPKGAAVGYQ